MPDQRQAVTASAPAAPVAAAPTHRPTSSTISSTPLQFDPTLRPRTPLRHADLAEGSPITPTFLRTLKNDDHTAYLISVSFRRSAIAGSDVSSTGRPPRGSFDSGWASAAGDDDVAPLDEEVVWQVTQRFSDFDRLHKELLRSGFREDDLPQLPQKKWLFNRDPNFVQQRMQDLQGYTAMLLSDPRVAQSPAVHTFFKVAENLRMDQSRRASAAQQQDPTTPRAAAAQGESKGEAVITSTTATTTTNNNNTNTNTTDDAGAGTSAADFVPVSFVALDTNGSSSRSVLLSSDLKAWKRETFLTLPWVHRESTLEVRFRDDVYTSFTATDSKSRGERVMRLRRRGGGSGGGDDDENSDPLGDVVVRVRLRTNKVKNAAEVRSASGADFVGETSGTITSVGREQYQWIVLAAGFVVATVLSWIALRFDAPLTTVLSLPLLPVALAMGIVFGDGPADGGAAAASVSAAGGAVDETRLLLSVGVTLVEYCPPDGSAGGPAGGGAGGGGAIADYVDMSGTWRPDPALSKTNMDPLLKAMGVGWMGRKVISALNITTVIKHSPTHFDRWDLVNGKRTGNPDNWADAFPMDKTRLRLGDDKGGFVHVRCWCDPAKALVVVETTIPESVRGGAVFTDRLTLQNNGTHLRQHVEVRSPAGNEPVFVDRILTRIEGQAVKGPGAWA